VVPAGHGQTVGLATWAGRGPPSGALVLEMSSSGPSDPSGPFDPFDPFDTLRLAAGLAPDGVRVVDAPLSGGVPRAVTGELSLMVGATTRPRTARSRCCGCSAIRPGSSAPAGSAPGTR
jgi:3-hydroxyisobutyrate dehydrogenase